MKVKSETERLMERATPGAKSNAVPDCGAVLGSLDEMLGLWIAGLMKAGLNVVMHAVEWLVRMVNTLLTAAETIRQLLWIF